MKDIESIEAYLMNRMDQSSRDMLEKRLSDDPPFKALFESYQTTFDTLKRQWIKDEISGVKQRLIYRKIILTGIIVVALLGSIIYFSIDLMSDKSATLEVQNQVPLLVDTAEQIIKKDIIAPVFTPIETEASLSYRPDKREPYTILPQKDSISPLPANQDSGFIQSFFIDNTIDNTIACKGGTQLYLKANTLQTQSGQQNLEKVKIEVTEFSNYFDMWQHKISTTSGNRLLESGGSCYIKATSNGENVLLQKGEDYTIRFQSAYDSSMNTFYGSRDTLHQLEWQQSHDNMTNIPTTVSLKKLNLTIYDTVYYLEPIISDEGYYVRSNSYRMDQISGQTDLKAIFDTLACMPSEEAKKLFLMNRNLLFRFGVNRTGKVYGYDYNFILPKKREKQLKMVAQSIVNGTILPIENLKFDRAIINVTLKPLFKVVQKDSSFFLDSNLNKIKDKEEKKQVYNALVSSTFGYVNCDKFKLADKFSDINIQMPGKADVRVFFRDFNAVVNCTYVNGFATYANVPENAEILIVTVLQNNMMCLQEAKVGEPIVLADLEPFDLLKLKHKLMSYRLSL